MSSTVQSNNCVKLKNSEKLLSATDIFIFDCDGVIWKGDVRNQSAAYTHCTHSFHNFNSVFTVVFSL
jgi:hypothetical protein